MLSIDSASNGSVQSLGKHCHHAVICVPYAMQQGALSFWNPSSILQVSYASTCIVFITFFSVL